MTLTNCCEFVANFIPVIPFQLLLPSACRRCRYIRMSVLNLHSVGRGAAPAIKSFSAPICGDRVAKANQGVSLKRYQSQLRRTCNEDFVLKVSKSACVFLTDATQHLQAWLLPASPCRLRCCKGCYTLQVANCTSRKVAASANATRTVVSMAAGGYKKILMLGKLLHLHFPGKGPLESFNISPSEHRWYQVHRSLPSTATC